MANIYNRAKTTLDIIRTRYYPTLSTSCRGEAGFKRGTCFLAVGIGMGADSVDHESGLKISH